MSKLPLSLFLLALPVHLACKSDEKRAEELQQRYVEAACRLYVEPECLTNTTDTCGFSLSFESQTDCELFFALVGASCSIGETLLQDEDAADACIAYMDAWDCSTEDICDADGNYLPEGGDCASTSAALALACNSGDDTGT